MDVPVEAGKPVHVVLAGDDGVGRPMAVAMRSVHESTPPETDLRFHVLHAMNSDMQCRGQSSLPERRIDWVEGSDRIANLRGGTGAVAGTSNATWLRLFAAELLPDVTQAVYLDCDTVCLSDITGLARKDLGGNPVGAVIELHHYPPGKSSGPLLPPTFDGMGLRRQWGRLSFTGNEAYFNAGVLKLDFDVLRNEEFSKRALELIHRYGELLEFMDQDVLNIVLANRWTDVCDDDPQRRQEWNDRNVIRLGRRGAPLQDIEAALGFAKIIHYVTPFKPWRRCFPQSIAREVYFDFESRTDFAGDPLEPFTASGWKNGNYSPDPSDDHR